MSGKMQPSPGKEVWINDPNNKKYAAIKADFMNILQQQTKDSKIGYYDFLLVAKKLAFRFEESSHLMALKNYFSKNKNTVQCKKLADSLCISEETLYSSEEKIIVKFSVPDVTFAPIKEETLEDEDYDENQDQQGVERSEERSFRQIGEADKEQEKELMEKMSIILSIKVEEMQKKLAALMNSNRSIIDYFDIYNNDQIDYEMFKKGVIEVISANNSVREKIKVSEDDVKTIFHLLDVHKLGFLTLEEIDMLKDYEGMLEKMKEFYKSRLNKDMVKNTLFKLGKVKNNSIQIYQLKNASLMEFKQIEESMINEKQVKNTRSKLNSLHHAKQKSRIPHFGPLKGAAKWKNNQVSGATLKKVPSSSSQPHYSNFAASTHPNPGPSAFSINKERQKIERILKQSKVNNRNMKNSETVASKLRSLFIHKVILPREKMLEQEKEKFLKAKAPDHQLSIKPYK